MRILIYAFILVVLAVGAAGATYFIAGDKIASNNSGSKKIDKRKLYDPSNKKYFSISDATYTCEQKLKKQFKNRKLHYEYDDRASNFNEEKDDFFIYFNIVVETLPDDSKYDKFTASFTCHINATHNTISNSEMQNVRRNE